jgi:hypothetical protein
MNSKSALLLRKAAVEKGGRMRATFIALAIASVSLALPESWAQSPAIRVALVIGNSQYDNLGTLKNTKNDATDIARALTDLGFSTKLVLDASEQTLRREFRGFSARSENATVAVVFYAGHGAQVAGENYLLPVDLDVPNREADIQISAIKVADLVSSIKSSVKIVFLDACRDNPVLFRSMARGRGSYVKGLAAITVESSTNEAGSGVFVAYATDAGNIAGDGKGNHSPFSEALLRHIREPLSIDDMFSLVTRDVRLATNNSQRPYKYASLEGIVCLPLSCKSASSSPNTSPNTPVQQVEISDAVRRTYQMALASNDWQELERIAKRYPSSSIATWAEAEVARIKTHYPDDWVLIGYATPKDADAMLFFYDPRSVRFGNGRAWVDIRQTDKKKTIKNTNTSVIDCAKKTVGLSKGSHFDDDNKEHPGPMLGDPRIIELSEPVKPGSVNEDIANLICPPSTAGRILLQHEVTSDNWRLLASLPDGNSLYVLTDTIDIRNREVRAIIKAASPTPFSDGGIEFQTMIYKVIVRCDTGDYANSDGDFLSPTGTLVAKLFPVNRMRWDVPAKTSPLEAMIKTLCLPTQ